jgi:hypothetical protein
MEPKLRVLFDLNVILDVLQHRQPFYGMSARALAAAEAGEIEGYVAAHSLTTLFYLLAKYESSSKARVILTDLLSVLAVAAVDSRAIEQALNLPYDDFEDAVQMMAAVGCGARSVVTRNAGDFKDGPLPALQPAELIALL